MVKGTSKLQIFGHIVQCPSDLDHRHANDAIEAVQKLQTRVYTAIPTLTLEADWKPFEYHRLDIAATCVLERP